jgi:hypothetical protein
MNTEVHTQKNSGYVALFAVIITSALLLVIGLGASMRGIDSLSLSEAGTYSLEARLLADACAEEALMKLKSDLSYTGNESIIVSGAESCSIVSVSGSGNTDRTVITEASVNGYVRRLMVEVTEVNPALVIGSWNEAP